MQEEEEPVAAVVVCDSFNQRFRPLTLDKPRCLLPLVNVPLLEYTLECLAVSNINNIYLVCCAHSDKIKEYIKNSRWGAKYSGNIQIIVSSELLSVGDAIRDMDAKQLLKSDFVLVTGDLVSNLNLESAIAEHRARKKTDKNSIMTMILKQADPGHRTRAYGEESLFVLDADTGACLHYDSVVAFPEKKRFGLDVSVMKEHATVSINYDLIDCQVDICSLEVLLLFTENFDYQDTRMDFLKGVLESDILNKNIYAHIINNEYAARTRSTRMYDSISRDVLARWTYPMVPDGNMLGDTVYGCFRPFIYKEKQQVTLARSTVLEHHVAVGNETVIGNDSRIVDSVIGKNCVIGDNCVIEGSYIWDNCVIEDGCNVGGSIIAEDCTVLTGVTIEEGCILGYGVFVGPACVLPRYTKLTTRAKILEYDGEIPDADPEIVGHEANCVVWHDEYDMDEDADEQDERNLLVSSLARDLDESLTLHDEDSESEAGDEEEYGEEAVFDPHVEIRLTLERSIEDEHTFENAALELNTLKMALNIRFHDIRQVIFPVLFRKIFEADGNIPVNAKAVFTRWTGLIAKFVHNTEDQRDCLDIMEEYCTGNEALEGCFMGVLKIMYEEDMLEEDTIFEWHHQTRGSSIGVRVQPLVSWLENASEESSEEGSGSE